MISRKLSFSGTVKNRVIKPPGPGLLWHLRNRLRSSYWRGWLAWHVAPMVSKLGIMTAVGRLKLQVIKADGHRVDYGAVGYRVITDVGVNFLVDAFQNSTEIELFNYHGIGTGDVGAEAAGDTALEAELTTQYSTDNTRATGTQGEGASTNIYQSVGTNTVDATVAIVEHGLLSQAATGGGTLWDRTVFASISLSSGDSLQSTYEVTCSSGG